MLRAMLFTQWKWTRAYLLPLVIATFAVPVYSVQQFSDASLSRWQVSSLLASMQTWGAGYMAAAMLIGLTIAAGAWSWDTKGGHVYALSLPIPRWHYLLLRFAAGAIILAVPSVFLWIGGLVATSSSAIPIGLRAYPTALALRFLLASFLLYSLTFSLSSLPKRFVIGFGVSIGMLVLADATIDYFTKSSLITALFEWAIRWPGFLEVFVGRWMLIDV